MKKYKGVLFDLDGTLVDNYTAIYNTVCETFAERGLPPPSYDVVFHTVGGSILLTVTKLLKPVGREAEAEEMSRRYLSLFKKHVFDGLKAMKYAPEILGALKAEGLKLACFTNKQQEGADEILARLGLSQYLDAIVATTLHSPRKPEPEFTRTALAALSLDAEDVLGIGDSPYDYKAARAVGADSAIVATGGDSAEFLRSECPLAIGVYPDFKALAASVFGVAL